MGQASSYACWQQSERIEPRTYLTKQCFADGRVCPICGGLHVLYNERRRSGAPVIHLQGLLENLLHLKECGVQRHTQGLDCRADIRLSLRFEKVNQGLRVLFR